MKLYLVGGFLGSGKTTAIKNACLHLIRKGGRVGVVTNDQGEELVDTKFIKQTGVSVEEVTKGCFCCNYNQLTDRLRLLNQNEKPKIVFAESVGSCTDLVATIAKPIEQYYPGIQVKISVFADAYFLLMLLEDKCSFLDDSVRYIYKKQLEEGDILILNKTDLLSNEELKKVKQIITQQYPSKKIITQNSLNDESISSWLWELANISIDNRSSLDIDYDVYGEGEASLAWSDMNITISTSDNSAKHAAQLLTQSIYKRISSANYPIGHLKFYIDDGEEAFKISYTTFGALADHSFNQKKAEKVDMLINARVQTSPEILSEIINDSIEEIRSKTKAVVTIASKASFQPCYPEPTHRFS